MTKSAKLVKLLEQNPDIRDELLAVLQGDSGSSAPALPSSSDPTDAAIYAKLLLEGINQIAANSADQTRAIARIGQSVEAARKMGNDAREIKRIGRDATEAGKMILAIAAIAASSMLCLVVLIITTKNALVDAIGSINPFDGSNETEETQTIASGAIEAPALLSGGELVGFPITSGFGMRKHPVTGRERQHNGVDFGMRVGTPLYAPADTTVTCQTDPNGYGTYATFKVGDNREILLGHLSQCNAGQAKAGQAIALSGNTGLSTAPHLHYEERVSGEAINPTQFLALAVVKGVSYQKLQNAIAALYPAIVSQESGGDHTATNDASGDRAIGITQVMDYNVPTWSADALGKPVSLDEFHQSPLLQRQISLYKMAESAANELKATGGSEAIALRRVAAVWYSGNPARESDYSPIPGQPDSPSVGKYVDEVIGRIQK